MTDDYLDVAVRRACSSSAAWQSNQEGGVNGINTLFDNFDRQSSGLLSLSKCECLSGLVPKS